MEFYSAVLSIQKENKLLKEQNLMLQNQVRKTKIESREFIIVTRNKRTHKFSMSELPFVHSDYQSAKKEAERLASLDASKDFIVVAVALVASSPKNVVVTYSLK